MKKNTILFVLLLLVLALGTGYGKYYAIQHHWFVNSTTSSNSSPSPKPTTLAPSASGSAGINSSIVVTLLPQQKVAQLLEYPLSLVGTSHHVQADQAVIMNENPGFVLLSSAPSLREQAIATYIATSSAHFTLALQPRALDASQSASFFIEHQLTATRSAAILQPTKKLSKEQQLANNISTQIMNGADVVIINPKNNSAETGLHLDLIIENLTDLYNTSPPFQQRVDQSVAKVMKAKEGQ